jgi:formyl-CoA transferase
MATAFRRPLDGVVVVSLEQAVAAPFASRQLADLGARVIKVERPGAGDFARAYDASVHGSSSYFVWLNRSKESLTLDVKQTDGMAILKELLGGADVFLHNLGPGAVGRLGLDAPSLSARYPRLVHATITGYGAEGAWGDRKAYDLLVQSEVGLVSLTGSQEEVARVGISVADIAAGMYAYSGILTALLQRATTGVVTSVEVSLFDALAEWMGNPLYYAMHTGSAPSRAGASHLTIAPYGPFTSGQGDVVVLSVQNAREWDAFCAEVMDNPDLARHPMYATNDQRVAHREELNAEIGRRFATFTTVELVALLDQAGVANARVNSITEVATHPALGGRDRWVEVAVPGGLMQALKPPVVLQGSSPVMGPVPAVGQHTNAILSALGRTPEQVADLRSAGVV